MRYSLLSCWITWYDTTRIWHLEKLSKFPLNAVVISKWLQIGCFKITSLDPLFFIYISKHDVVQVVYQIHVVFVCLCSLFSESGCLNFCLPWGRNQHISSVMLITGVAVRWYRVRGWCAVWGQASLFALSILFLGNWAGSISFCFVFLFLLCIQGGAFSVLRVWQKLSTLPRLWLEGAGIRSYSQLQGWWEAK